MTRFRCESCDTTFEVDPGADPPRCPECLRQHGIEEVDRATSKPKTSGSRRRSLLLALALVGVGSAAAVALWLDRDRGGTPAPGELGILDPQLLRRTLKHRGVSDTVNPFEQSAGIKKLAARASGADPGARAAALAAALAGALTGAGLEVDLKGASDAPVRTAAELQALLDSGARNDRQHAVLSFELATHAVALLRAAGLRALLCQADRLQARVATGEISGGIGRYVAAVYGEKLGGSPLVVLDPARALPLPKWAGGGQDPTLRSLHRGKLTALDDGSAAAHLLALRAFRLRTKQPDKAYRLSEQALAAAAPSATLQLIRAKVLAAAGGTRDAISAVQKALSIRDGPPARTLLGLAQASEGSLGVAVAHLEQALQADTGYWPAHHALASILLQTDPKRGARYLDAGLKVAPEEPELLLLQATRLIAADRAGDAVTLLEALVARQPSELTRLMLYRALKAAGQEGRTEPLRRRLVKEAADPKKMKQLLEAMDQATAPPERPPPLPKRPPKLTLPDVKL